MIVFTASSGGALAGYSHDYGYHGGHDSHRYGHHRGYSRHRLKRLLFVKTRLTGPGPHPGAGFNVFKPSAFLDKRPLPRSFSEHQHYNQIPILAAYQQAQVAAVGYISRDPSLPTSSRVRDAPRFRRPLRTAQHGNHPLNTTVGPHTCRCFPEGGYPTAMSTDPQSITATELDPCRWLEEYGDALFRYALGRLRDIHHAEDMVQETLKAALQARASYSGRASEKTWLTGILKHKIIDFIRKQVRETTVDDINVLSDTATKNGVDDLFDARGHWVRPPRDWGDPDKALHNDQFLDAFEVCLSRLKPALAQVFALKELSGLSNEEICNELDITATNCGVMLYRARMGLRRCLDVRWPGGNP